MRDRQIALVAGKDFADASRSRVLWGLTALLIVLLSYALVRIQRLDMPELDAGQVAEIAVGTITGPIAWLVPIAALVAGYMSIVGERRSGSIKLLFGQPFDRDEVLVGKIVGRAGVVAVAVVAAFIALAVLLFGFFGTIPIAAFLWLVAMTIVLGAVFAALAVSISAVAATRRRAVAAAVGFYAVFHVAWTGVVGLGTILLGGFSGAQPPSWYLFLSYLSPTAAYTRTVAIVLPPELPVPFPGVVIDGIQRRELFVMQSESVLLNEWIMLLVLVGWGVLAVLLARYRFQSADLG